jgi:hypothetical protein
LSVAQRNGGAFLDEMSGKTINSPLGEFLRMSARCSHLDMKNYFSTGLAGVLVAVRGILEFLTAFEKLENELIWFSSHGCILLGR